MKIKISMLGLSLLLCGGLAFAGDSVSNRKEQTVRLGQKSGTHLMYATSTPFVLEFPGEEWTLGLTIGSGKYNYSYSDYNSSSGAFHKNSKHKLQHTGTYGKILYWQLIQYPVRLREL
ncbi:MAG: hypothetical protein VYC92_07175 [SAR324 cluster bacterium]|nr:hypothetical protein [SAR324 cluster bacterium]